VRSPIGGIFRHIADLASAQREAGHQVGLICDSLTGGDFEAENIAALAPDLALGVVRLPMRRSIGPADAPAVFAVSRHVARMRPDVIHAHGAKGGVFGRLAAAIERRRGRNVAAFYAPHGGSLHYEPGSAAGRLYFGVERGLERLTQGLLHVSAYEAETYRQKVGAPRCPAHVVVNGLRPAEFEPVQPNPDAADFLYMGMLRDLKGVDVFLQALAAVSARGDSFKALVIGAGEPDDERRYRAMVGAAGLEGAVTFRPPTPARQAFAMGRVLVVPSRAESMPYIVLEAAAAALPLIATHVGGIPEILDPASERLLPPGDADALAEAMRAALRAPDRMQAAAMLRRERMAQRFSLATMATRIEAIYRGALERRYRGHGLRTPAEAGSSG
jgi:glycosyltransferase involved in cell wall biosynthesis